MSELQGATPAPVTEKPQPQEAPPGSDARVEALEKMPSFEQTQHYLGGGQSLLREKMENLPDEQKALAEEAILYKGGAVTPESSGRVKALFDVLGYFAEQGDGEAAYLLRQGKVNARVQVGEGDSRKIYTLEEWDQELQAATPEERAKMEAQALRGFINPDAAQKHSEAAEKPQELPEDKAIATHIAKLQLAAEVARARGEDPSIYEHQEAMLRVVAQAQGEIGVLVKVRTLLSLRAEGSLQLASENQTRLSAAQQRVVDHIVASGVSEEETNNLAQQIREKGLMSMLDNKAFKRIEGLDVLVFGRELSEKEIKNFLSAFKEKNLLEKYGRGAGIAALLVLLFSIAAPTVLATKEIANTQQHG